MKPPPQSDVVVVVSANVEWRAIERIFSDVDAQDSSLGRWFIATLGEPAQQVLFFHGGWGKIAAAASTQYLIDHCRPRLIVNLGTCGGFHGAVERGTIVLVERTVVYDIFEQMGDQAEHLAHYASELDLECLEPPYPHEVVRTLIVSGDRDLVVDEIPRLARDFGAVVGDWE